MNALNTHQMSNLTKEKAADILNKWIADCDKHGVPGDYEIRRANHGEILQSAYQGNFKARWVCELRGSQFQARETYRTLADVLRRHGVPGY